MGDVMKKSKAVYIVGVILLLSVFFVGWMWSRTKLTYLEYKTMNEASDIYLEIDENEESISQQFIMPYDIMNGISLKIGAYARNNNSRWLLEVSELNTGKEVCSKEFNASCVKDCAFNYFEFDRNVRVKKGQVYTITIKALDVQRDTCLAFFASASSVLEEECYYNNAQVDNDLCLMVYGGDSDPWWLGLICVIAMFFLLVLCRCWLQFRQGKELKDDVVLQAFLVAGATFLLLCSFAVSGVFTDEFDNIRGGLIIADGGVLYRDYVTQHTPVTYYLCAVFAWLGAGSIEQFRLSFYITIALFWGILYARHVGFYGVKKMAALPVLEAICISSVVGSQGHMVLSDSVQGIFFVAILLEYIRYLSDKSLDWKRCIVLSMAVWGSFGAAFVSAFSLIFLVLAFLVVEVLYWKTEKVSFKGLLKRYYKLVISLVVPLLVAIAYLKWNRALWDAYEQAYLFNRKVYPYYLGGLGDAMIQPFINGVQNFFSIIAGNFNAIVTATATNVVLLQLVIMVLAVVLCVKLMEKKRMMEALGILPVLIFAATRGYGFHGLAAWYVAVFIIVIYSDLIPHLLPRMGKPMVAVLCIILFATYVVAIGDNILTEQESVTVLENQVVALTEGDEDKGIFMDAYSGESIYLYYKGRKPVNEAVYMLPWYMDWYEKKDIIALREKRPKLVIFNEDRECWGYSHYTYAFEEELRQAYTRLGDSDWQYSIWIRNE